MSSASSSTPQPHAPLLYAVPASQAPGGVATGGNLSVNYGRMQPTMEFPSRQSHAAPIGAGQAGYVFMPAAPAAAGAGMVGYGSYHAAPQQNALQREPLLVGGAAMDGEKTEAEADADYPGYQGSYQQVMPSVPGGPGFDGALQPGEVQGAWQQRQYVWLACVCLTVISMLCTIVAVTTPAIYASSYSSYGYFKYQGTQEGYVSAARAFAIIAVLCIIVTFVLLLASIKMGGPKLLLVTGYVQLIGLVSNVISISVFVDKDGPSHSYSSLSYGAGLQITAAFLDLFMMALFFYLGGCAGNQCCQGGSAASSQEGRRESHLPLELSPHSSLLAQDPLRCAKFSAWLSMFFLSLLAALFSLVGVATNALFSCASVHVYWYYTRAVYAGYFRMCTGSISSTASISSCDSWSNVAADLYPIPPTNGQQAGQGFAITSVVFAFVLLLLVIVAAFARVRDVGVLRGVAVVATVATVFQAVALATFVGSTAALSGMCYDQLEYGGILQVVSVLFMLVVSVIGWVLSCKQMGVAIAVKQSCCKCC